MVGEGRAVAAEPVGGERATAYRYASMAEWIPDLGPRLSAEQALAIMAPLWMRANGPGTVDDLAWWAGVTKRLARAALAQMDARVIEVEGLEGDQWATDEVVEGLASAEPTGEVRLLPVWDAWLMARRERSRILEEAHKPFVVDKSGNVSNTVTLDGRVVGVWDEDGETLLVAMHEGRGASCARSGGRSTPSGGRLVSDRTGRATPLARRQAERLPGASTWDLIIERLFYTEVWRNETSDRPMPPTTSATEHSRRAACECDRTRLATTCASCVPSLVRTAEVTSHRTRWTSTIGIPRRSPFA